MGDKTVSWTWNQPSGNGRPVTGYQYSVDGGGWQDTDQRSFSKTVGYSETVTAAGPRHQRQPAGPDRQRHLTQRGRTAAAGADVVGHHGDARPQLHRAPQGHGQLPEHGNPSTSASVQASGSMPAHGADRLLPGLVQDVEQPDGHLVPPDQRRGRRQLGPLRHRLPWLQPAQRNAQPLGQTTDAPHRTSGPHQPAPQEKDHSMTMTTEQAEWFAGTFDKLVANVGQAVLGKEHVIRLTFTAMLAEGHVLFEDAPGTGKTMLARAHGRHRPGLQQPHPVHPGPAALGRHRRDHLRPEDPEVRVPQGPDLQQHRPGRRNQPCLAEDPVGTAGGHGGIPGHRGRRHLRGRPARLW